MKIPKYPIYSFTAKWTQKIKDESEEKYLRNRPEQRVGEDHFLNSTYFTKMFETEQSEFDLNAWGADWFKRYVEHDKIEDAQMIHWETKLKEYAEWHLEWFSHSTFLVDGITDEEYLESFEQFVNEKHSLIEQAELNGDLYGAGTLMGAEDMWRWRSGSEDYESIPCRCEHCVKQGIVKITH